MVPSLVCGAKRKKMTNAPNPGNEPEPNSGNEPEQASTRALRQPQWRRWAIVLSIVLLTGIGGGVTWAWIFIQRQLAPLVEDNVTKLLNRPVNLGKLESFSLNSLRFGATKLPATPTDTDRVDIEAVDVTFNPVQVLLNRTLPLEVTLVKPDVYIEQDKDRVWVATKIQPQPKGAIDVKLQALRLRDADVVLVPRTQAGQLTKPVGTQVLSGTARFLNDNKLIQFGLDGSLVNGGSFSIQGENRPSTQETNLAVSGSELTATEIGRLLQLPLVLQAGKLDGNLEVKIQQEQPLKFLGTATLKDVTARIVELPQPFAKTNGQLRFQGTQIRLEKVTTLFGQIPAVANGAVDTQSDYNLSAQTQPVELKQVLQTFKIQQLPVAASAQVQAVLQVTGPLNKPVVSGAVATTKSAQIDRVNFRKITAGFGLVDSRLTVSKLRATPTVGGLVTGKGEVQLGQKVGVKFDFQADNVPGDAIAKTYELKLPVPLGLVSARTQISGSLSDPENIRATGSANLNLAGGAVTASNVQVVGKRFSAQIEASGLRTERLAQVPPQFRGPVSGNFNVSGALDNLTTNTIRAAGSGSLNVAGGTVNASNVHLANGRFTARVRASGLRTERLAEVPPQFQGPVSGNFNISGALANLSTNTIRASGSGSLNVAGGTVNASNVQLANGRFTAQVRASEVQTERLAQVPPQFRGPVSGNFNVSGALANLSTNTIRASGSGSLNVAGGTVNASNVQLANGRFSAQVRASGVQTERLAQVPPQFRGPLSGNFNVSGALANLSPETIRASGSGSLNVAGGTVNASNLQLENGRFSARVRASGVQVERLAQVPPQFRGPLSGNFEVAGALANLSPETIRASGSGSLNVAGGTISASNLQLENGRFSAQVRASEVQVERLAQVPPQLRGPLSGNLEVSGTLANLSPETIRATGSGLLNVAGGTVSASNLQLENGRFQAVVEPTGVQLAGFSQDLRGSLGGRLNVSGSLTALNPSAIQASGQLNFSEGIALINQPLTADISWNGQQLQIQQATANGFNANGVVNVNLANTGLQAIQGFDLNVQAKNLNLQQLPAALPNAVSVAGQADFDGRIAGTVASPNVNGTLALRDFAVDGLKFESLLEGSVSTIPGQALNLNLAGANDQIQLALAPNYQPLSFLIKRGETVASGQRQGELLRVSTQNFPIALLKELTPVPTASSERSPLAVIATQPLSGVVSGNLEVNVNTFDVSLNDVAITGPIFEAAKGDQSQPGNNRYVISGNILRTATGPEFKNLQLRVEEGQLPVVLAALEAFNLTKESPSLGNARDVSVAPVTLPDERLQIQLQRFSEIEALLAEQRQQREATSPLPELSEVKGSFTGTVTVNGSLASGISANVNIDGKNWEWGSYKTDQVSVIADASFQNGVLTLLPLRFQSGESYANFSGTIGGDAQSGQLQLRNVPIDQLQALVQEFSNLPPATLGFTGLLNATATLSGSIDNPQARGELEIIDATLNQQDVQSAKGSFSYNNARLNFSSSVLVAKEDGTAGTDPLSINGSIPYKLPFASVAPTDNRLNLDIDVQNEGLALLNILTRRQLTWVGGAGNVDLAVEGIFDQEAGRPRQLIANGIVTLDNATIGAQALPDPLTNVTGTIEFDFDRIKIDEPLRGNYGGGEVSLVGTLPISQQTSSEQIQVTLDQLALNLKGLYRGGVRGQVQISGSALEPVIAGGVELFDGQVQLAERGAATGGGGGSGGAAEAGSRSSIGFNGLELKLGRGIQITRAPILNFLAEGTLTIEGSLDNPKPEGEIRLTRGQVNLFTTQFRLARGYENTAQFLPNRGLDPILDVRLDASVAETTRRRLPTDTTSAEISDAPALGFGSVQTVRIQARVEGPASRLLDVGSLELTSSPPRSEAEIVALIGGGFVETLGRGDTTLGLANLAGSALLSNVQNVIGDALGLSEFRLFPTIITDDDDRRSSTLGLSAEAGLDITGDLSVSVSKELTTDQPFRYGLRYRLNNEVLLRGDTDLSGDSRAVVEYERRF